MMCKEQRHLLHTIDALSLALLETNLYLDTHPHDMEAQAYFMEQRKLYLKAREQYESQFAPLTALGSGDGRNWMWVKEPWPWEMEG